MCTSLAWSSHNENRIATGGQSGSVCVMDWRKSSGNGSSRHTYQPHTRDVTKLAFVPWNSSVVASVSEDTAVKVFSVTDQSTIYSSSQHTDYVHGVSWHPCKPCFLTCGWDGQLLLHSLEKPSAAQLLHVVCDAPFRVDHASHVEVLDSGSVLLARPGNCDPLSRGNRRRERTVDPMLPVHHTNSFRGSSADGDAWRGLSVC